MMPDEELAAEVLKVIRKWSHSESSCVSDPNAREVCRATLHNLIRMVFDHDEPRAALDRAGSPQGGH